MNHLIAAASARQSLVNNFQIKSLFLLKVSFDIIIIESSYSNNFRQIYFLFRIMSLSPSYSPSFWDNEISAGHEQSRLREVCI